MAQEEWIVSWSSKTTPSSSFPITITSFGNPKTRCQVVTSILSCRCRLEETWRTWGLYSYTWNNCRTWQPWHTMFIIAIIVGFLQLPIVTCSQMMPWHRFYFGRISISSWQRMVYLIWALRISWLIVLRPIELWSGECMNPVIQVIL